MKDSANPYRNKIENTNNPEFGIKNGKLNYHGISLMDIVSQYDSPLKFSYLPQISTNIAKARAWFLNAFTANYYQADYNYCYCLKSSYFSFILDEVVKNNVNLEVSSANDIEIIKTLKSQNKIDDSTTIICNGFKPKAYINQLSDLLNGTHTNCIPVLDNTNELEAILEQTSAPLNIGLRLATIKKDGSFSRLGITTDKVLPFFTDAIKTNNRATLKMLHFFVDSGIDNSDYYWNQLSNAVIAYIQLKKESSTLDSLNIGGGFPIKTSLDFDYDYQAITNKIVAHIATACKNEQVEVPNIYTEFGSYTVGESGGFIAKVLDQKIQSDTQKWNIIDSSILNTLPDTWALNQQFIVLPLNRLDEGFEGVSLGGLTCDGDDTYTKNNHQQPIYLPKYNKKNPLYIGVFNTGAYQDNVTGFGGLQHCLIPSPQHVTIDTNGNTKQFSAEQKARDFKKILGY